jgi:UDP-glucose 4-epimerase
MTRVGITGGTGYIGGRLAEVLSTHAVDVVLVDDGSGPVFVPGDAHRLVRSDFAGVAGLSALADCDAILHLGAVSGVMACARNPEETRRKNVEGTRALLAQCAERKIPLAFASSMAVVGSPSTMPVVESTPVAPTHEYARQKAEGERMVSEFAKTTGMRSAALRMSNVYGTYQATGKIIAKGNVVTEFIRQARAGRITVNAPGTQRRDFIHLDDVAAHWVAVLSWLRDSVPDEGGFRVFNVARGQSLAISELADLIARIFASKNTSSAPPTIEIVSNPRAGVELVDPSFRVDRSLTERILGIRCSHRLEEDVAAAA